MNFDDWSMRYDTLMELLLKEFERPDGFGTPRSLTLTEMLLKHCYLSYKPKWNYGK